jgi:hypothetical protein
MNAGLNVKTEEEIKSEQKEKVFNEKMRIDIMKAKKNRPPS